MIKPIFKKEKVLEAVKLYNMGKLEHEIEIMTGIKSARTLMSKLRKMGAKIPKRLPSKNYWEDIVKEINKN